MQHPARHPAPENRMLPLGTEAREARFRDIITGDTASLLAAQKRLRDTEKLSIAFRSAVGRTPEALEEEARRMRATANIETSLAALLDHHARQATR